MTASAAVVSQLEDFPVTRPFPTRWNDNDMFGHVNNPIYYVAMDTTVDAWFRDEAGLDPYTSDWINVVASSSCDYLRSVSFPDTIAVGMGVEPIGRTSITWRFGLFREVDGAEVARGRFVHVIVARMGERRPVPLSGPLRALLDPLVLTVHHEA